MKKSILICSLFVMIIGSSFANNSDAVSKKVSNSFQEDFAHASQVQWENKKDFVKATFLMDGQTMFAYYSHTGDLIALTRNIISSQLPVKQLKNLKKYFSGYWITDLFQMDTENETVYYITIENEDYKEVLKSTNGYGWELYKKEVKM